jgi:hypothetical protein
MVFVSLNFKRSIFPDAQTGLASILTRPPKTERTRKATDSTGLESE